MKHRHNAHTLVIKIIRHTVRSLFHRNIILVLMLAIPLVVAAPPLIRMITAKSASVVKKSFFSDRFTIHHASGDLTSNLEGKEKDISLTVSRGQAKATFAMAVAAAKTTHTNDEIRYVTKDGLVVRYQPIQNGIKEEIILESPVGRSTFFSTLSVANVRPIVTPEGQIVFVDQNGAYQFHVMQPFAVDANGTITRNIRYRLTDAADVYKKLSKDINQHTYISQQLLGPVPQPSGPGVAERSYMLVLDMDPSWLADPSRAYPVTIDPTVVHDTTSEFATGTMNRVKDTGSGSSPIVETPYQEHRADNNTVSLWHMDESADNSCSGGQDMCDAGGGGRHGVATGTTIDTSTPRVGSASRVFNGTSDYIEVSSPLLPTGDFTYEMWVKPDTTTDEMIVMAADGAGGNEFYIQIISNVMNIATNGVVRIASTRTVTTDWQHIAVTRLGSVITLYINGVADAVVGNDAAPLSFSTCGLLIGTDADATCNGTLGNWFDGEIDELRISGVARSPDEIQLAASKRPYGMYTSDVIDLTGGTSTLVQWNGLSWNELGVATGDGETLSSTTSLVAQWNFNETSGTTAANNAGSCSTSCNGSLTGFSATGSQDAAAGSGWTAANKRWGAGALMFDESDDVVTVTDTNALSFGSGGTDSPMTMEAWVFPESIAGTGDGNWIMSKRNAGAGDEYQLAFYQGSIYASFFTNNTNSISRNTTTIWQPGKWYYIVATYDGSESTNGINIYVNGVLQNTAASTAGTYTGMANGSADFLIGKAQWSTTLNFDGVIDSARIYSRVLSQSEIITNYNASNIELQTRVGADSSPDDGSWEAWRPVTGETAVEAFDSSRLYNTTDTGLVSYFPMDESANNTCTGGVNDTCDVKSGNDGAATGTKIGDGVFGNTRLFNGTSDKIDLGIPASLNFERTDAFSAQQWIKTKTADNQIIVSKYDGSRGWTFFVVSDGTLRLSLINTANTNQIRCSTTKTVADGTWHHVAFTYTGSSAASGVKIYIDGVNQTLTCDLDTLSATIINSNANINIGAYSHNATYFNGSIDEVRIYNTAISESIISASYIAASTNPDTLHPTTDTVIKSEGAAAQKIQTGQLPIDSATVGYWTMDETGGTGAYIKDTSANANNGTPTGTTSGKGVVKTSRNFDGTDDVVNIGDVTILDGATQGTISVWINPDTLPGASDYNSVVAKADFSAAGNAFFIRMNGLEGVRFAVRDASGNQISCDTAVLPSAGVWTHIYATFDTSDTCYVYMNGLLQGNYTNSAFTSVQNTTTTLKIGASNYASELFFDGRIDEVVIRNVAGSAHEAMEAYRAGRDHTISTAISSTDVSSKTSLPFAIAADKPGTYLSATLGESGFANYQPDNSTIGLWHLDERNPIANETFSGTAINVQKWVEIDPNANKIAQNNGIVLTAGAAAAWDSAVVSQARFTRAVGQTIYARFLTGASVAAPNHMMIGFATDTTGTASYTNINHALYFNAGTFYVYQNGSLTGGPYGSGYTTNTRYEVKITLTTANTASYSVRGGAYTNWTTLLSVDTSVSNTPMRVQVAQYQHTGTFEEISVIPAYALLDATGYNQNATTVGVTHTAGKIGGAKAFNGGNDHLNLGSINHVDSLSNMTADAWIYPTLQTAATHFRVFSKQHVLYVGQYGNQASFYIGSGAAWTISDVTGGTLAMNQWNHVAWVKSGTSYYVYINGALAKSGTGAPASIGTNSNTTYIGSYNGTTQSWAGNIDEVRLSNTARSAEEIRQTYEAGLRTHPITIDFAAILDSGNLITGSGDTGFTVDATGYGLASKGSGLYLGDKVIVRENYDGTEYIAQGTVTAVTASTGAVTVASWDTGSTFPSGGYTASASVFKWQREYWNITEPVDSHINAATMLTLRLTDGVEGRTLWFDDFRSAGDYLTTPAGSTITSSTGNRYVQYRAILHSSDEAVSPQLTSVTVDYRTNVAPSAPTTILTEGTANPTGVIDTTPEFSAIYVDGDSGDIANKYRIQVDDNSNFSSVLWDSGASGTSMTNCTAGNRCADVSYAGSALSWGTTYYIRFAFWDDDGTEGAWSSESASFTMNAAQSAPTLDSPPNGATNRILTVSLKTTGTDTDGDYLRYKIELCTNSGMTANCQTFDQTSSQTGWSGQNTQTSTAYTSGTQATYTIQTPLTISTTYYWRSYSIDPGGTNTWSPTQGAPYSFTTTDGTTNFNIEGLQLEGINLD